MSLLMKELVFALVAVVTLSNSNHSNFVNAFHQSVVLPSPYNNNHHRLSSASSSSSPSSTSTLSSTSLQATTTNNNSNNNNNNNKNELSRRSVFAKTVSTVAAASVGVVTSGIVGGNLNLLRSPVGGGGGGVQVANAIGPVKINLLNPTYTAIPCPKDRPIPGEKAMKGMRGLCVTVNVDLEESPVAPLSQVGVYGYITDKGTAESVLANNPDGGTDAGQFAMVDSIKTDDKKISFEFIAAVPMEQDLSGYEAGIGPIIFKSLRVVSFPGGQQYGTISPCEMNEFSDECEAWETENGSYTKKEYMIKSNPRTKGR